MQYIMYVLTRYLYVKSSVKYSLKCAISRGDKEQALFWAYELYKSGFQTEVIQLLFSLLDEKYARFSNLRKCLQKKYEKWKVDYKSYPTFVGTMITNMIIRNHVEKENQLVLIVECKENAIVNFQTKPIPLGKSWKYLGECCEYPTISEMANSINLFQLFQSHTQWIYYASYSPIWNMRLQKYKVKVNHEIQDVTFQTDDAMESFMDKFGFEPDEQPLHIQQYCVGLSK